MKTLRIIVLFLLLLIFPQIALAGTFSLKTIGALNVDGVSYKHYWYTNGNLTFSGSSLENAQITATIDGTSQTITADSSGNWSHHVSLADGDHDISFTSNGSTITFVLTIGENIPENVGAISTPETPTVGTILPTLILFFGGIASFLTPFFLKIFHS